MMYKYTFDKIKQSFLSFVICTSRKGMIKPKEKVLTVGVGDKI